MSFQIYTEDTTHSDSIAPQFYLPIYEVDKCKFYIYDGIKYHIRFPLEWATEHYSFPIHIDNQQNEELEETVKFIYEHLYDNQQSVLVHCAQGKSRSSTVVAFIMVLKDVGFEDALVFVRKGRRMAEPNANFETHLKEWYSSKSFKGLVEKYTEQK